MPNRLTSSTFRLLLGLTTAVITFHRQAPGEQPGTPVFKDGEAQIVKAFEDSDYWIRHDLWVQTEFDSDGDDKLDRMHVSVTRPRQTESESLKLPALSRSPRSARSPDQWHRA